MLCEGGTLKVTRLDRLSRSVLHLVALGAELRERGIRLHVIEQGIGASTMEGRAVFRDAVRPRRAPARADRGAHQRWARLRTGPRPGRRTSAGAHARQDHARPAAL
ncbi:recombinase family protein [Streptomyces sp. NPDC088246]|uniref:recombinase family protein n=1 Tax=Streptomyces sp. NPDC088246 TaxID=3365842 RepID=UPI0038202504